MKRIVLFCAFLTLCLMPLGAQKAKTTRSEAHPVFRSVPIPDSVFQRMRGYSYPEGCTVKRYELRYLRLSHYDLAGRTHVGELVCNVKIANDLIEIFRQLYEISYPIERMRIGRAHV